MARRHWAAAAAFGIALGTLGGPAPAAEPGCPAENACGEATDAASPSVGTAVDIDQAEDEALARLAFAGGVISAATTSVRAANSLTAAGLHVAPRYMSRNGDVDVSALGGYAGFPTLGGNLVGAQFSIQARLSDGLVALADTGHMTSIGLRGPIWGDESFTLGWDARYRSDIYFDVDEGIGLSAPGFGLVPGFPGVAAQGAELAINGEFALDALRFYLSPSLLTMSNRLAPAAAIGVDWDLDRFTVGYGASLQYNASSPGGAVSQAFEQKHSVGARFYLFDWAYLQANYHFQPADSYGQPSNILLAGIGTRLLGNFSVPVVRVADRPAPEALPEPDPAPEPTASPGPSPVPGVVVAPVAPTPPVDWDSLKGRVVHSLSAGGDPGKPVTVGLKVQKGGKWVNAPFITRTDDQGNYVFHRLPDGNYQVVYRNDRALGAVVGAAVSPVAAVRARPTAIMDQDVARVEPGIRARIRGKTVTVDWPAKPGVRSPIYQVILKFSPSEPYIVGTPYGGKTTAKLEVSDEVAGRKLYYTVKYLKGGGKWEGANFYGQSNYKVVEVEK